MQNRIMQVVLVSLAAGFSYMATQAAAETYKWTDSEGKVHYSDQPPPSNVKDPTTMTPRKKTSRSGPAPQIGAGQNGAAKTTGAAKPAPVAAKTAQELDAEFKQRQVEAAEKGAAQKKLAQEAQSKNKNCAQAQANVARLQTGGRVARANDKGETEYLDDAQIAQELLRARETQDSWCK